MKKINIAMTAAALAAVLFSCGGNNQSAGSADTTNQHHDHGSMPASVDTSAIKEGQEVFFANLKDGQTVPAGELKVEFGVKNMILEPANTNKDAGKGHHHLLVDTMLFIKAGESVPDMPGRIMHFGKAQTSTTIKLKPGKHKLALQFANGYHQSYGIRMSKAIEITVK